MTGTITRNSYFKLRAPKLSKAILLATLTGVATGYSATTLSAGLELEELIVTATKREVGLQDVPIALSVVSAEMVIEQGITDLEEMSLHVPNFTVQETSGDDSIYIRGIGSQGNRGFEQSVGTFIDGVYFGRGSASRNAFLDIGRVEVLKGPQSTLFGKNTIAGALNITTARPTDEFEAIVRATAEPEFGGWSATGILSGPLADNLRGRVVVQRAETDGFMDNKSVGRDEQNEEDTVARIVLDWDASENLNIRFKYEDGDTDTVGRQTKIGIASESGLALYQAADPTFEAGINHDKWSLLVDGRPEQAQETRDWKIATLTAEWQVGEYSLRSITGYLDSTYSNIMDVDFSPVRLLTSLGREEHEQISQEFLLSSPTGRSLEFLAGVYYQDEDQENFSDIDLNVSAVGFPAIANATTHAQFQQDSSSWSAFTQLTWHVSEDFRLIGGIRYAKDEKELEKSWFISELLGTEADMGFLAGFYFARGFGTTHTIGDSGSVRCPGAPPVCADVEFDNTLDEDHVTGDITLQWDLSDDVITYLKVGNGYKAGGFDARDTNALLDSLKFEDETVQGVELGAKIGFADGRGRLNMAAFYNEFDDVQVSIFTGGATFLVDNAAESESVGLEIDGSYLVNENLTLSGAVSLLRAEYALFDNAQCTNLQAQATPAGEVCEQDLSGEPLNYSPDWSGNLTANYRVTITDSMELGLMGTVVFTDSYHAVNDNDPLVEVDGHEKINARISLSATDGRWTLALLGKNLTDETVIIAPNDAPLGAFGFAGSHFMLIDAPRSYELLAEYRF